MKHVKQLVFGMAAAAMVFTMVVSTASVTAAQSSQPGSQPSSDDDLIRCLRHFGAFDDPDPITGDPWDTAWQICYRAYP